MFYAQRAISRFQLLLGHFYRRAPYGETPEWKRDDNGDGNGGNKGNTLYITL